MNAPRGRPGDGCLTFSGFASSTSSARAHVCVVLAVVEPADDVLMLVAGDPCRVVFASSVGVYGVHGWDGAP